MSFHLRILTGEEIRCVSCPVCKAPPGNPCTDPATRERRAHHHRERVTAARTEQRSVRRALDAKRQRVADRMFRP